MLQVKKWEEDDFYASDEDEFLDRTGSIERKRKTRMKMAGKNEEVTETYESLMKQYQENQTLLKKHETELKEAVERKVQADERSQNNDLDSYLAELKKGAQVDKETVQKLKLKISNLNAEQERLGRLINIAKPASLPELKAPEKSEKPKFSGIMIGKRGSKGILGKVKSVDKSMKTPAIVQSTDTKIVEAFLSETEEVRPRRSRPGDENDDHDLAPIGYEPREEPKAKGRIGDTSANVVAQPKIPLISMENGPAELDADEGQAPPPEKRKRGDRGARRKRKVEDEEEDGKEDDYYRVGMDKKYDVWVPPTGQTGDGRTSLNDKFGY